MINGRNLGPTLAAAGGAAALGAVIWGLIAVGGPGDARAERIDRLRLDTMRMVADLAGCAFHFSGKIPATIEDARMATAGGLDTIAGAECHPYQFGASGGALDAIDYRTVGADKIELCATFLRPTRHDAFNQFHSGAPEFEEVRDTAGKHCYTVDLAKFSKEAQSAPFSSVQ